MENKITKLRLRRTFEEWTFPELLPNVTQAAIRRVFSEMLQSVTRQQGKALDNSKSPNYRETRGREILGIAVWGGRLFSFPS